MPTPQRARRPRYENSSSLYCAILSNYFRGAACRTLFFFIAPPNQEGTACRTPTTRPLMFLHFRHRKLVTRVREPRVAPTFRSALRSAGILPAVVGARHGVPVQPRAGRMPTPQRARRPRYENSSSLYCATLRNYCRGTACRTLFFFIAPPNQEGTASRTPATRPLMFLHFRHGKLVTRVREPRVESRQEKNAQQ